MNNITFGIEWFIWNVIIAIEVVVCVVVFADDWVLHNQHLESSNEDEDWLHR